MSASPAEPTLAIESSSPYTGAFDDTSLLPIAPNYVEWAVAAFGNQFDRISMELLQPDRSSNDRMLAQFVEARTRLNSLGKI